MACAGQACVGLEGPCFVHVANTPGPGSHTDTHCHTGPKTVTQGRSSRRRAAPRFPPAPAPFYEPLETAAAPAPGRRGGAGRR